MIADLDKILISNIEFFDLELLFFELIVLFKN